MDYSKKPFSKHSGQSHFFYGADYNPDQWQNSPDILERDIELMREAGVTSASVGIFSWTSLEPEEGVYEFEWLDRVMDRFAEEGMFVFLATPSGSKPMWMSEKYPEIRRVGRDGVRESSGRRHNHCLSSPLYREKVAAINTQIAGRYKEHPALKLWHIGNEYSGNCHCPNCRTAFQNWLKNRYLSLYALNQAWWAGFWNHTFTKWSQIPTHDPSIDGLELDWLRFTNDQHVSFMLNEMRPLRELTPDVPCTTNFMGTHESTNYWQWAEHLDVISNDLYPLPDDREDTWRHAIRSDFIHSMMRGMSGGKPWMLLECSPSSVNWGEVNKLKRPGAHRQEVLQAVANGASTIHYFQWRKSRGGFEKYHGAVIDHESSNRSRVFKECAAIGAELKELSNLVNFDCPPAEVAMIYDWESRWALNTSRGPKIIDTPGPFPSDLYTETCFDHYEALTRLGISVDFLSTKSDFSDYKVLILPALYLVTDELSAAIREFVRTGGRIIATYLTAYVGETNLCHLGGFPGSGLRDVFGIWNEEIDNLHDTTRVSVSGSISGKARDVVERIHLEGAKCLAQADSEFYAGHALITKNSFGDGAASYLAARFELPALLLFYKEIKEELNLFSGLLTETPEGVVFRRRESSDGVVGFLFNYSRENRVVDLTVPINLDKNYSGPYNMKPYESLVIRNLSEGADIPKV